MRPKHQTLYDFATALLRRTNIQRRFIVAFLLLSLTPVLVIGIAAYRLSAESLNKRVGQTAGETVRLLGNNVLSELSPVTGYINSLSTDATVQQVLVDTAAGRQTDKGDAARSIKIALDASPFHSKYFKNIQFIDRDGTILYDFIYGEPQNAALTSRLKAIDRTSPNDSIQFAGTGTDAPTVLYGRKLHNLYGQNEAVGYLLLYLDEGIVGNTAFAGTSFGPDSKLVLLSVHDRSIISSTDKALLGQSEAAAILSDSGLGAADTAPFSLVLSGRRYLVVSSRLSGLDCSVVALIPDAYVTKDIAHIKEGLFWTACLMIVISLALAMLIYTSILQPIKLMKSYCSRIAGDPCVVVERLNDTGGDELHVLSETLDSMVVNIQRLMVQREADEKRKRELELERLQYQINPHFLFNTLDTLSWIAEANEVPALTEGLSSLSRLLRNTLVETKEYIPLSQELDILKSYVAIQRIRYAENFEMTWHIDRTLEDRPVPRFILQPLVENAVIHGTYDTGRIVTIDVSASAEGTSLILKISDDGKGFDTASVPRTTAGKERYWGIGLQNVSERLRLHYGTDACLTIESVPGKGTVCTIRLPLKKGDGTVNYTILLVDDDSVVKMTLRSLLAPLEREFSVVKAVSDGREACLWLESHHADIVITDLIMPGMTGLQLIEALGKTDFSGVIMVLSNYSDFELVRQALLMGAQDYLLKADLKTVDLAARLRSLAEKLSADSAQSRQQNAFDVRLQCAMVRDYLISSVFPESRLLEQSSLARDLASRPCAVCRLRSLPPLPPRTSVPLSRLADVVQSVYEDLQPFLLVRLGDTELAWILPQPYLEGTGRDIRLTLEMLRRQAMLYFSLDLVLVYGPFCLGMEAVRHSFKDMEAKMDILFYGRGRVASERELVFGRLPSDWNAEEFARELLADYETEERERSLRRDILWRCSHCRKESVDPEAVRAFFLQTLDCIGFLRKVQRRSAFRDTDFLDDLAAEFLKETIRLLSGERTAETHLYGRDVQTLLKYLNEHYTENLSLDQLVDRIHLNKSYLCRLFKKETGMSIGSYVTKLRIEKACTLMDQGSQYIKEIASAVGFEDQLYFTRVFSRTMGISPTRYVQERRNREY